MVKIHSAMPHLNGNLLCAVDVETTGVIANYHEIIQIALVPLDSDLQPVLKPFYLNMKPNHPLRSSRAAERVHKLDIPELLLHGVPQDRAADMLSTWFKNLDLPFTKRLTPLAHNWSYESSFLKPWLGIDLFDELFHPHARDAMILALAINDRSFRRAEKAPFKTVNLNDLCDAMGVVNEKPHDALHDCLAEAEVYRRLLQMEVV